MINKCTFSPTNSFVDDVNNIMIKHFPSEAHSYTTIDRTFDECYQGNYNFLNSQNPNGIPPYKVILKRNCPLIILRNLNPIEGLCNGTHLICRELKLNTIFAKIASGHHKGKQVLLPRIPLQTPNNEKMAFLLNEYSFLLGFVL